MRVISEAIDGKVIKTIRRKELRMMIPLADSTIFEMEKRGEFPKRFALGPRCVVWDLEEVQAWLRAKREKPFEMAAPPRPSREQRFLKAKQS
jgi:prophage regulatory protein